MSIAASTTAMKPTPEPAAVPAVWTRLFSQRDARNEDRPDGQLATGRDFRNGAQQLGMGRLDLAEELRLSAGAVALRLSHAGAQLTAAPPRPPSGSGSQNVANEDSAIAPRNRA